MTDNLLTKSAHAAKAITISSPCIDICALDDNDICIGCYRHGNEISHWGGYSNAEKIAVLEKSQRRSQGIDES